MRVEGVARADVHEVERQPLGARELQQMIRRLLRLRDWHAVLAGDEFHVRNVARALRRCPWIQLERAPDQLDLGRVWKLLQRALQPALADVAPRARDIRPDFQLQRGHGREHKPDPRRRNRLAARVKALIFAAESAQLSGAAGHGRLTRSAQPMTKHDPDRETDAGSRERTDAETRKLNARVLDAPR